ncbi:MAG: hypothetical protein J1E03_07355 [Acetatifactor sp.]|nr:hypothetical protein [Acetatifactor sp.]
MKKLAALLLAAVMATSMIGCGSSTDGVVRPKNGLAEGKIGDTMRTYWFDFSVNSAYLCDSFSGYDAADGYNLLVVDITVTNTFSEILPMYDDDFWIDWDSDDDDAYAYPVENASSLSSNVLPSEYYLMIDETENGLLLYEIPDGYTDLAIAYIELTDQNETGDFFVVYFEPDQR